MFDWHPLGLHDIVMVLRTLVLYTLSLLVIRLMGKRVVGQLSPFDLLVIIIIGSAIAIPMEDEEIPLVHGVIPIVTILVVNYALYWLIQKNRRIEDFLQGTSTILIKDGRVLVANLKRERITLADLLVLLREKGVDNIRDIREAAIEPNGRLSMLKEKWAEPVSRSDLTEARSMLGKEDSSPAWDTRVLGLNQVRKKYGVDLNLLLDALALGLQEEEIAAITNASLEAIREVRRLLGDLNASIGLGVTDRKKFVDAQR